MFFLGQQWVRDLIAEWHQQGDRKKINQLFFGTSKKGVGTLTNIMEEFRRDMEIAAEVARLLDSGQGSKTAAFKTVGKQKALSHKTIGKIYRERKAGHDPFAHLLSLG